MSDPAEQPLEPSSAGLAPARPAVATQADPLAGDWSEGLRGPLRASGLPAPRPLASLQTPSLVAPTTVPAAQAASVDLSGWGTPAAAPGDEDLLVPVDPFEETVTTRIRPEAPPPGAGELWVPGEHRVAVHTREGGTRRGIVRNVDLSASSFALLPHAARSAVQVAAAEVKAVFFMLGPGETIPPAGGARIRVMFLDGRTIEGTRDSGDAPKGFFLVPSDAARTSTRRIFVARAATKAVHEC
jgi:hypothetical protein